MKMDLQPSARFLKGLDALYLLAVKHPDAVELIGFHGPLF